MNNVQLSGRLTRDPELRKTGSGKSYLPFTIAVNEFSGGQQKASFFYCSAFDKIAETIAKYCEKGSMVLIEGSLHQSQYDRQDGEHVNQVSVNVRRFEFMGSPNREHQEQRSVNKDHVNTPEKEEPIKTQPKSAKEDDRDIEEELEF